MARKKGWVPGVPAAEYTLEDGGILQLKGDKKKLMQCPFCDAVLRGDQMEEHIRTRLLNDLSNAIGECRALQLSHAVRDRGDYLERELMRRCREEHKSRMRIILMYGDPFTWEVEA